MGHPPPKARPDSPEARLAQIQLETKLVMQMNLDMQREMAGLFTPEPDWIEKDPRPWLGGWIHPGWENGWRWLIKHNLRVAFFVLLAAEIGLVIYEWG